MELAIRANIPRAVKIELDNGASTKRLVEIQHHTTTSPKLGALSSIHAGSVAHVSVLHIAIANCFTQGEAEGNDIQQANTQQANAINIVK